MKEDKYQITAKAQYVNLLLLHDELKYFDSVLVNPVADIKDWLDKLRATRSIFLTLNNVKDAADRLQISGSSELLTKTRNIKRSLLFANHFRNRGIGHLDDILLKRAVQWHPQIFYEAGKENELLRTTEAHRAVIESCINSFLDKDGKQKVFGHEIDLMYPPDAKEFFNYLYDLVNEAIDWLQFSKATLFEGIELHVEDEVQELAAIASRTNFNLKEETVLEYSKVEMNSNFQAAIKTLEKHGADSELLDLLKQMLKT